MNRTRIAFLCALFGCCTACSAAENPQHDAEQAMAACIEATILHLGTDSLDRVDHVYVHSKKTASEVLLAHGEAGTFGVRSNDYFAVASCATTKGPSPKVTFLAQPLKDPVINSLGQEHVTEAGDTTEQLFLRERKAFRFCCAQKLDESNFKKHNPTFKWNGKVS